MIYFGIDGGGTKTHLVVEDNGVIVSDIKGKSINIFSNTKEIALANLDQLLKNINGRAIGCLGIAGIYDDKDKLVFENHIKSKYPNLTVTIENDALITLIQPNGSILGSSIISGTGSIAIGYVDNTIVRVGGYGHIISDEGSAYSMSITALKECVKIEESRSKYNDSSLYGEAIKFFDINKIRDILVAFQFGGYKSKIAKFAPLITIHALQGDKLSKAIIDEAVNDIYELGNSLLSKYPFLQDKPISLLGGVLLNDKVIRNKVKENLILKYHNLKIIDIEYSAAYQALLLAKKSNNKNMF